jgi:hypothetical protein
MVRAFRPAGKGKSMGVTIRSFGAIFFGFGITFLIIGWLGVRYGARPGLGNAGLLAAVGIIGGVVMLAAGTMMMRSAEKRS